MSTNSGRDTVFTTSLSSFTSPHRNIPKRPLTNIEASFGVPLSVKNSGAEPERKYQDPCSLLKRNMTDSFGGLEGGRGGEGGWMGGGRGGEGGGSKVDVGKRKGQYHVDMSKETENVNREEKSNVKSFAKHKNQQSMVNLAAPPTQDKLRRVDKILDSTGMWSVMDSKCEIVGASKLKSNKAEVSKLVEAAKEGGKSQFKNPCYKYKHFTKDGQVFYLE